MSFLSLSLNDVTRDLETVTPSHWLMGIVVLQFNEAVPLRVSLAARSTLQSATKLASSGSGTATLLVHEFIVCAATGMSAPATKMRPVTITADQKKMRAGRTTIRCLKIEQLRVELRSNLLMIKDQDPVVIRIRDE